MKKLTVFLLLTIATTLTTGCSESNIYKSNQLTLLNKEEVLEFMEDKGTGFLYIKSAYESREEEEAFYIKEIERVTKAEKIDFYIFDAGSVDKDHTELGVDQYSRTFVFYQNGEMKEELDFADLSEDDVPSEVETFVQNVKEDYLK
ncbi:hypothetical protein [Bacillus sp. V2I10]|uniref:hypothetical protein n=1 Tax=Bacillus sp. V2I10 TaxID=3042276 RepID=UPI00278A1163|nr:hypothetical protein [Bacillus sp. V2I10]MDQ0856707.1 hypothetical protein [Bacillus sp. V2I10]